MDWSRKHLKAHLTDPRRFMWLPDTVAKLAAWTGFEPGMTTVDVGCGLGYLGWAYWPYFGKGGRYIGVDISPKLAKEASATSSWAEDGSAYFAVGDANRLPFQDGFADVVMCQTLLMYQPEPLKTLAEMVRIAKPGGFLMCKERDNLSLSLSIPYSSLPEWSLEERLFLNKVGILTYQGRIKLGRGDFGIGPKIPRMMQELGLTEIDVRLNDKVDYLQPPYEGEIQAHRLSTARKLQENQEDKRYWGDRTKEEFLSGGGTPGEYERYEKLEGKYLAGYKKQTEEGTYFICQGWFFYVVKGRKPVIGQ